MKDKLTIFGIICGYAGVTLFVGMVFILIGIMIYSAFIEPSKYDKDCLEQIAENYCVEQGMEFDRVNRVDKKFYCLTNNRKTESEKFRFLEEELEECRK